MRTASELVKAFREDVLDTKKPYLWSDDEVYRYADAAFKQFVRKMGGIADFTSDATAVAISAGESIVDLHPSILHFRAASLLSSGQPVDIINIQDANSLAVTDYGRIRYLSSLRQAGPVRYLIVGQEQDKGQLVNVPTVDDTLNLVVYRLPLVTLSTPNAVMSEVPELHHPYLLFHMKHLAYLKQDAEVFNRGVSENNRVLFEDYCRQAKSEWDRYKHKPREVAYGGL